MQEGQFILLISHLEKRMELEPATIIWLQNFILLLIFYIKRHKNFRKLLPSWMQVRSLNTLSHHNHRRTICTVFALISGLIVSERKHFLNIFNTWSYILTMTTDGVHLEFPIGHPPKLVSENV